MLLLLRLICGNIREFDDKNRDYRSENYFLLSNPLHMVAIVGLYYVFVKYIGPKFMEKRKAFDLKNAMLIYNFLQVLFNAFLAVFATYVILVEKPYPNYGCMMPHFSFNRWGLMEMNYGYAYLLLKIVDFMDTIFFVLRKREKQITFLHFYHHIMVSVGSYMFMRYLPGGHGGIQALFNVYIHTMMYFYYFMSALRPEMKNSLWWKKYITQAQILQFVVLIFHFARPLLFHRECSYSIVALLFALTQNVIMAVMFLDFYYRNYVRKLSKRRAQNDVVNIKEVYEESLKRIK